LTWLRGACTAGAANWPLTALRDMFGIREPPDIGTVPGGLLGLAAS
jgi:hypothetical protein